MKLHVTGSEGLRRTLPCKSKQLNFDAATAVVQWVDNAVAEEIEERAEAAVGAADAEGATLEAAGIKGRSTVAVSYTHLTLPTICSV
eukprot:1121027-Rhodomonas_salina.1